MKAYEEKTGKKLEVTYVPISEFGGNTEGRTEGVPGVKANIQGQLKALGIPYASFYTGPFADYLWMPYVS